MKKWIIVITVAITAFLAGIAIQYHQDQQLKYKGLTIQEWSQVDDKNTKDLYTWRSIAHACANDPSSSECYAHVPTGKLKYDPVIATFSNKKINVNYQGDCKDQIGCYPDSCVKVSSQLGQ